MNARLRQIVHYHYHFKVFMVCFITKSCKIKDVLKHCTIKAGKKRWAFNYKFIKNVYLNRYDKYFLFTET